MADTRANCIRPVSAGVRLQIPAKVDDQFPQTPQTRPVSATPHRIAKTGPPVQWPSSSIWADLVGVQDNCTRPASARSHTSNPIPPSSRLLVRTRRPKSSREGALQPRIAICQDYAQKELLHLRADGERWLMPSLLVRERQANLALTSATNSFTPREQQVNLKPCGSVPPPDSPSLLQQMVASNAAAQQAQGKCAELRSRFADLEKKHEEQVSCSAVSAFGYTKRDTCPQTNACK